MSDVTLSIVVPAFNEEANLGPVIDRSIRVLDSTSWLSSYEIIVVDDGSRDGTGSVADQLAGRWPNVHAVHHESNRGFGAALKTGYARASGRYATVIPADGELEVEQALQLFQEMGDADVMVSRRERGVMVQREFLTRSWHLMMRILLGFDLRGIDGIYVIRTEVLRRFKLRSDTGLANLEVLMQCYRDGVRVRSGVMVASPRLSGESKVTNIRTISKTVWEMVKLRVAMVRDRS